MSFDLREGGCSISGGISGGCSISGYVGGLFNICGYLGGGGVVPSLGVPRGLFHLWVYLGGGGGCSISGVPWGVVTSPGVRQPCTINVGAISAPFQFIVGDYVSRVNSL